MKMRYEEKLFILSIIGFFISSESVLFVPVLGSGEKPSYFVGIMFWLGIIMGVVSVIILKKRIAPFKKHVSSNNRLAIFCFFSSKISSVIDVIFIIASITLIISAIVSVSEWTTIIIIFTFVFSLEMHCLLNCEGYRYLTKYCRGRKR